MPRGRPRKTASAAPAASRGRTNNRPQVPFADKLVLNQWLMSLFNVKRFDDLAEHLRSESLEGLDENNVHHFHHALKAQLLNLTQLPTELLLEYDQNIVKHTQGLNERRTRLGEEAIVWKYFQYLTLLFTEIYLDRYFRDPKALLAALNAQVAVYNADKPESDQLAPFDVAAEAWPQLNKIAFWMATGSGKTLVMHANILQFQFYLRKHGRRRELNRIILLTPNEGLSQQHLREFEAAGIVAELFNKDGRGSTKGAVEILEITKLRESTGEKTIAIDAFESNNLVLVDEGHRGTSSGAEGAWMKYRNALCENGFSFEYSATFGQAVKGNPKLIELYTKSTLFDYSYQHFYDDGFGKDYQILNLEEDTQQNHLELYLVACLLSFFQQQRIYREQGATFRVFNIEKPLWIFVGGSVTATLTKRDASDIVEVLQFLARYVTDRTGSIQRIEHILSQGITTITGKNLFVGQFEYLNTCNLTPTQVFDETLGTIFNAPGGGQIYVENLKNAPGEVALRLGVENEAFGVINVGDDAKLVKLCDDLGLATGDREFSGSLFHEINKLNSPVNLLIGSKKFTEGWSSWRVSTMGLMNVGKGEGAQIIQLFGRGVRLKGYDLSLKRSDKTLLPEDAKRPKYINVLETLGIFGIHADYIAQFRDFLELTTPENRTIPTDIVTPKKTSNDSFRKLAPMLMVASPTSGTHLPRVILNWYPKIQALKSRGLGAYEIALTNDLWLTPRHTAFLDIDRIYFELERFKAERGWYNLNITRQSIEELLADHSWYQLQIPPEDLAFDSFERVHMWGDLTVSLLKKYIEQYYTSCKREWDLTQLV
jgi:hypothetical protein